MNVNERRREILKTLGENPISATNLAKKFGVTRQVIVSDIALLRASGQTVVSTPKGYVIEGEALGLIKVVASIHLGDKIKEELYAIVDNGGKLLDVIVEHPVYGQIQIPLRLASRHDCDEFIERLEESDSPPLAELSGGVHYHSILCPDEACFGRIKKSLKQIGVLFEE